MRAFAAVLLVFVAWNADVEAFPVAGESVALGDANAPTDLARVDTPTPEVKGAPQTAETLMAKAKADAGKQQVDKMLARYAETTKSASQPLPSVSPITPISVGAVKKFDASSVHAQKDTTTAPKVSVDNMNANTHIYKEPVYTKPTGQEYLNRELKPGHPRYAHQMSEKPIYTYNHEMHHMNVGLQRQRDHAYRRARGAKNVLTAANQGAQATADMAFKAREEQEANLAESENKIAAIKVQIAMVAGHDNKAHAKLQLQLERAKKKHAQQLATAASMGRAVDKMIAKAGEIVGRARADFEMVKDPTTNLEDAIIAAAQAKMALKAHDQEVEAENKRAETDKKNKAIFKKANANAEAGVIAVKEKQEELNHKANQQDFQVAKQAAARAASKVNSGLVTVPPEAVQPNDIQRMAAESNALAAKAAAAVPTAPAQPVAKPAKEVAAPAGDPNKVVAKDAKKDDAKPAAKEGEKKETKEAKPAATEEAKEGAAQDATPSA